MTDREKLIELIDDWVDCVDLTHWYSEELDERLADYLIENGATTPVRCGDCKHKKVLPYEGVTHLYTCSMPWGLKDVVGIPDFCPYGERGEDETN